MSRDFTAFKKQLEKAYDGEVFFGTQEVAFWDSGIYSLNKALGGGFAAGRFHLLAGKESSGKSTIASKLCGRVNTINWDTGEQDLTYSNPCAVCYVDAEATLDESWCRVHDFDPNEHNNAVVSTVTGNQTVDAVNAAIGSGLYSLIVVDSIEALVPQAILNKSAEDEEIGQKAKMVNSAFRRWQTALTESSHDKPWWQKPTVLVINQLRDVPMAMYPTTVIPSGVGQRQFASTIIKMGNPQVLDEAKKDFGAGTFKGLIEKNKIATPKKRFEFDMTLLASETAPAGEVDNVKSILKDIRANGIWFKTKDGWDVFGEVYRTQSDFEDKMRAEPDYEVEVMNKVIKKMNEIEVEEDTCQGDD